MTVASLYQPKTYKPGSAHAAEPIGFAFVLPTDLSVTVTLDATGETQALVSGTDYTISASSATWAAGTATITATGSWAADDVFTVTRNTAVKQEAVIAPDQPFPSRAFEASLDRLTLGLQEAQNDQARSVKVPAGEDGGTVPSVASRAGTLFGWAMGTGSPIAIAYDTLAAALAPLLTFIAKGDKGDPGSPGEGFANRAAIAALTPFSGDDAYLAEGRRAGRFMFDTSNRSAFVTADPAQGVNIAPASDPTGASGAWVRVETKLSPDHFGALGDGATDDTAAINALSNYVTALGGGVVELRQDATYMVCGPANQPYTAIPVGVYYNRHPIIWRPFSFIGLTKPLIFNGNGATVKNIGGGYYGVFNADGTRRVTAPGYVGDGASIPYYAMIYASGCTGGGIIHDVELDGNIGGTAVGGYFSDTGIQLPMDGIYLESNFPAIKMQRIHSHHHGRDGAQFKGTATNNQSPLEGAELWGCQLHNNGRLGLAVVRGRGGHIGGGTRIYENAINVVGSNAILIASNPASGIDFETESGVIRRWLVDETCEIYNNYGQAVVADSGDTAELTLRGLYAGSANGYTLWVAKPDCKLENATVVGSATQIYVSTSDPSKSFRAYRTTFTSEPSRNPGGFAPFIVNGHLVEGGFRGNIFEYCKFIKGDAAAGGAGNTDGPLYINCQFVAKAGNLRIYGRFEGTDTRFVDDGGAADYVPGGVILGSGNAGKAYDAWTKVVAGVATEYPATCDRAGNLLAYQYTAFDADRTLTAGVDEMTWIEIGPLTADRTWTLATTGARVGSRFRLRRTAASTGAFNRIVKNAGGTTLGTIATGGDAIFEYVSAAQGWLLVSS